MTEKQSPAERRRAAYDRRVKDAAGERERLHALVWWWLSEIKKLSPGRRQAEMARLERVTADVNEGRGDRGVS